MPTYFPCVFQIALRDNPIPLLANAAPPQNARDFRPMQQTYQVTLMRRLWHKTPVVFPRKK
jgi:hypothetical protein